MAIQTAKDILLRAAEGKYAVGAFNITNIIQMEAVVETAVDMRAPLIIQTSVTPSKFLGRHVVVAVYRALAEEATIPVALHLDHCKDVEYCKQCADAGYTNIMIDASPEPLEANIQQTRDVADYVHAHSDGSVEGELGRVGGVEDEISVDDESAALCDPDAAVQFVTETDVDIFAPAIGTAHGVYKTADPKVDFQRFSNIRDRLAREKLDVPLVVDVGTGKDWSTAH